MDNERIIEKLTRAKTLICDALEEFGSYNEDIPDESEDIDNSVDEAEKEYSKQTKSKSKDKGSVSKIIALMAK